MTACGTSRRFCGNDNGRPASSKARMIVRGTASIPRRSAYGSAESRPPAIPAITPESRPPSMSPAAKAGNCPRQTDEVSKSAELRLQTEPDNENAAVTPSNVQARRTRETLHVWCTTATATTLAVMRVPTPAGVGTR